MINHPHRRADDKDRVIRWGDFIEKWFRLAWPFIASAAVWFGATVWAPIRSIPALTEKVDSAAASIRTLRQNDVESKADRNDIHGAINTLSRIACFDMSRTDRLKYDIDCSKIPLAEVDP